MLPPQACFVSRRQLTSKTGLLPAPQIMRVQKFVTITEGPIRQEPWLDLKPRGPHGEPGLFRPGPGLWRCCAARSCPPHASAGPTQPGKAQALWPGSESVPRRSGGIGGVGPASRHCTGSRGHWQWQAQPRGGLEGPGQDSLEPGGGSASACGARRQVRVTRRCSGRPPGREARSTCGRSQGPAARTRAPGGGRRRPPPGMSGLRLAVPQVPQGPAKSRSSSRLSSRVSSRARAGGALAKEQQGVQDDLEGSTLNSNWRPTKSTDLSSALVEQGDEVPAARVQAHRHQLLHGGLLGCPRRGLGPVPSAGRPSCSRAATTSWGCRAGPLDV